MLKPVMPRLVGKRLVKVVCRMILLVAGLCDSALTKNCTIHAY